MRRARKTPESGHKRAPQEQHRPREAETPAQQRRKTDRKEGAPGSAETKGQGPESLEGPQGPTSLNLQGAAFPDFQGGAGVEFLRDNLGGDKLAFARDRFTERVQNGQRVSVRSPVGGEERGCVGRSRRVRLHAWFVCSQTQPVGRAESRSRCRGRCGGGGEDVGGSEVSARNEAGNLGLGSAVAGLSRGVHKCSDRVVAACDFAQSAARGVGGACVQGSRLAGSTGHKFTPSGAAQAQANRVNVLLRMQHSSIMRVDAPHPCVINLSVTKFQQSLILVHLKQLLTNACAPGDVHRLHHHRPE